MADAQAVAVASATSGLVGARVVATRVDDADVDCDVFEVGGAGRRWPVGVPALSQRSLLLLFFASHAGKCPGRKVVTVGGGCLCMCVVFGVLEIVVCFLSGPFRPPSGPGLSQDVAMGPGYVLARPRPRGRPKKTRNL